MYCNDDNNPEKYLLEYDDRLLIMAMRDLVEGECGQANPLMKFVSLYTQDKSLSQGSFQTNSGYSGINSHSQDHRVFHEATEQELVGEYFSDIQQHYGAPQTFSMGALLHEIKQVEPQALPQHPSSDTDIWTDEYLSTAHNENAWVQQYVSNTPGHHMNHQLTETAAVPTKWAAEYLENLRPAELDGAINMHVSNERDASSSLQEGPDDPQFANSKITEFESSIETKSTGEQADRWVDEYEATVSVDEYQHWLDEYAGKATYDDDGGTAGNNTVEANGDFWGKLEEEWYNLARENNDDHPWLAEYSHEKPNRAEKGFSG